jgi:hypothetical protein
MRLVDVINERALGEHWWLNRGLGRVPPQDLVTYRLYDVCDT